MGMLVEGRWVDDADCRIKEGAFVREPSAYDRELPVSLVHDMHSAPRRYVTIVSLSCPWSHRVLLVRILKRLEGTVQLLEAGGPRIEGYALNERRVEEMLGVSGISHVHQLYALNDDRFSGRVTVPLLWDTETRKIISNESGNIIRALDAAGEVTLVPAPYVAAIDELNHKIHEGLSNAVYQAGLAQSQTVYDAAVSEVFDTLDWLERRLRDSRFLFGRFMTESDMLLFATLVRFDSVYATHFRCTYRRLVDHPNLWNYARDIYAWPGVANTVNFDAIQKGYYLNDGVHNPFGIVARLPDLDWQAPHDRDRLGLAQLWSRQHGPVDTV